MAVSCSSPSSLFFFSSRRRHTRCLSDWSSDVCSSDLAERDHRSNAPVHFFPAILRQDSCQAPRSEERRVGKECRSRWSCYHSKKKDKTTDEQHCVSTHVHWQEALHQ